MVYKSSCTKGLGLQGGIKVRPNQLDLHLFWWCYLKLADCCNPCKSPILNQLKRTSLVS